jgi:outer membrane receptor for ferrienterochelin and colicins
MKSFFLVVCCFMIVWCLNAQDNVTGFTVIVIDKETNEPLPGATVQVKGSSTGTLSNGDGRAQVSGVAPGSYTLIVRFVGFREKSLRITLPMASPLTVYLSHEEEHLEEVVITTTRSGRTIERIPTRVEYIGAEELEEKITMQPGNIRMVLSESTGIQTQQTSVSSANATIRIQGLDGRYTQLLKDGFPLYGGFSGGLSIMQIPPLDLMQVDVIKGSASTLYGGGAIAGIVNLISKTPDDERELLFFANGTSALGLDLSTFYSEKYGKAGVTLFASRNSNAPYDPADIGLSAIPDFTRYTVNPKLFFHLGKASMLTAGLNAVSEKRVGGNMNFLQGKMAPGTHWFEQNNTHRYSTQLAFDTRPNKGKKITLRNSFNVFGRNIEQRGYKFSGQQLSSFSEVTYESSAISTEWMAGLNLWTDDFDEGAAGAISRDFSTVTAGVFVQNLSELNEQISVESGLRLDNAKVSSPAGGELNDWLLLPRASVLIKFNDTWSSRIGGGLGYKSPTIFTEKAEEQVFGNVRPLNLSGMKTERSIGVNGDVNFVATFAGEGTVSVNQMVFYTRLNSPLEFHPDSLLRQVYFFRNSTANIRTAGAETNLKITWKNFILFGGYTFVDAVKSAQGKSTFLPQTARHRINSVLMYEIEDAWRVGLEAFYFSKQSLTNGFITPDYWILGFSAQKKWEHFSVFINFENFTDTRQTRFGNIYDGSLDNPVFSEIYAPLDGFVFNAGFFIRL